MKSEKRIASFYVSLCNRSPSFRKATHRWLYEVMARNMRQDTWNFMNYGYACRDEEPSPILELVDECNRQCKVQNFRQGNVMKNGKEMSDLSATTVQNFRQ